MSKETRLMIAEQTDLLCTPRSNQDLGKLVRTFLNTDSLVDYSNEELRGIYLLLSRMEVFKG